MAVCAHSVGGNRKKEEAPGNAEASASSMKLLMF
jgi:hypothetical protein